jgi:glutamate-1-semialdehyde aminotransferase
MNCKDLYLDYLIRLSGKKLPLTRKLNEEQRPILTNHRSVSGITLKNKELCYTVLAQEMKGSELIDIDGNHYTDLSMGFGVHLFGHHPDFITGRIREANEASWGLGPINTLALNLARGIAALTGAERMAFFNSGTEAIMVAIRLARAYTGKKKIVIFKDSYHGHNDSTLVFKTDPMSQLPLPLIPGVVDSAQADTYLLDYDQNTSVEFISEHASEIAGVLVEPVQSRNPALQPVEFIRKVRALATEKDITLIFDEMITGFRIHPGGAQRYFGVTADIVTYGKIIGGGMPIGIAAGRKEYLDLIDGGMWNYKDDSLPVTRKTFVAGTFCSHPLSMAAANAVIEKLLAEGETILNSLNERTLRMVHELNEWTSKQNIPIRLDCFGSLFRIHIPTAAKIFFQHVLLEGIYIWEGKTCFLSTAHTDQDIQKIAERIKKCALLLRACGFFPGSATNVSEHAPVNGFERSEEHKGQSAAFNIGVHLDIIGKIDMMWMDLAIRFVIASAPELNKFRPAINIHQWVSENDTTIQLNKFINSKIAEHGVAFLLLTKDDRVRGIAAAAHKKCMDGWSVGVILNRVMEVYDAFVKGEQLPDHHTGLPDDDDLNDLSDSAFHISAMVKKSFLLETNYNELKRQALKYKKQPIDLVTAAFIYSYQEAFTGNDSVVIGTPVARQVRNGKANAIGPFTFVERKRFALNRLASMEDYLVAPAQTTDAQADCVINIDRVRNRHNTTGSYAVVPYPLDPDHIRYDMVVNILSGRDDGLWVDFKWRQDARQPEIMERFIDTFRKLIGTAHEVAGTD